MSELVVWGAGTAAAIAVILVAGVMYGWYGYLARRLPLVVYRWQLESELAELAGRHKVLEGEVDHLRQEKAELDAEVREARSWLEKNQERIVQIPAMQQKITQIEEALREKREALEELENAMLQAKGQRLEEAEKLRELTVKIEAARRELTDIQTRKDRLQADVEALQADLEALQTEHRRFQSELSKVEGAYRQKEAALRELESRASQAESRLREAQDRQREAEDARRDAESQRARALHEREAVVAEVRVKQQLLENLNKLLKEIPPPPPEKRLADFLRPVLEVPETAKPVAKNALESECLKACQSHLEKSGYRFPLRTLLAFHTSLKTADICPLVVLAGISGTGKSQLPRLYAEAMGMLFLNVAVQPRWDAPQDLLGFYNYMEHSYKATELARALRQMDRRNWPSEDEPGKRVQDGMLLVLLDEMNLARVEYYFSELLSKLEMRNAIGRDGSDRQGLADIEIEVGPLGKGERTRRLFVGSNVLFVGTMNEDETTQALSDKVIDRSNVLRFGKPRKLTPEKVSGGQPPSTYLPYAVWQDWLQSELPSDKREEFDKLLRDVNAALSRIRRPFGHRVSQAMYRYVANYPQAWDQWFPWAVADQFEQKIIPRLRGLSRDLDENAEEVLEQMKKLVASVGDKALEEAFEEACKRPVFQWMGVERDQSED